MVRTMALVTVIACFLMSTPCLAADTGALAEENAQLRQRVENLERQVQDLQTVVGPTSTAETPGTPAEPDEGKKPFWSTLDVQFYGYIKADASWDSSRVNTGNFVTYVEADGEDDDEFNLTARQTRLGLKINGPNLGNIETKGLIEGDFYGAGGTENKNIFRMRHGYLQLLWPEDDFSILAGQTWDVVSPLYPETLNFTILWAAGNIGYRHPQVRVTKQIQLQDDVQMELAGAISRTISDIEEAGPNRPGEDAGFPTVQGRVALTFPWFGIEPTTAGLSGHYGEEEYDLGGDVESWSINVDILQPVNEWLVLKAEAFMGENLDDYYGGIGQGVRNADATADGPIGSKGGWVAAGMKPCESWRFNAGIGIDDVDSDDLGDSGRTLNRSIFGNAIYAINEHTDVGVELSQWRTDYKNASDEDDVRIQGSFIYKF